MQPPTDRSELIASSDRQVLGSYVSRVGLRRRYEVRPVLYCQLANAAEIRRILKRDKLIDGKAGVMLKSLLQVCSLAVLVELGSCAVPEDISNYQNEYVCSTDVRVVRCSPSP